MVSNNKSSELNVTLQEVDAVQQGLEKYAVSAPDTKIFILYFARESAVAHPFRPVKKEVRPLGIWTLYLVYVKFAIFLISCSNSPF